MVPKSGFVAYSSEISCGDWVLEARSGSNACGTGVGGCGVQDPERGPQGRGHPGTQTPLVLGFATQSPELTSRIPTLPGQHLWRNRQLRHRGPGQSTARSCETAATRSCRVSVAWKGASFRLIVIGLSGSSRASRSHRPDELELTRAHVHAGRASSTRQRRSGVARPRCLS